jgi:cytidylate kinase
MTLVALSASYGAAGGRIGRAVAERLGVPFVDRAIPAGVAASLDVPFDDAAAHDERPAGGWLERMLKGFIGVDTGVPTPIPAAAFSAEDFRIATKEVIARQAETGRGVILGRGSVIVLKEDPRVLRVRLTGPAERRIEQAMRVQSIDRETAERVLHRLDRTHSEYAAQFYGVDIDDHSLYHLMIDSTSVPVETCVELIVAAAAQRSTVRA